MSRISLQQAFETCQKNRATWLTCKAGLAKAEMEHKERTLTAKKYNPEVMQPLCEAIDVKRAETRQSAARYIRAHEAVQRVSMRRQLHAFMSEQGAVLADALAPELMHITEQPEQVKERALDRAAIYIREALSLYLASGAEIHYAAEDRDILTAIGFRPDRASREDNQVKKYV